MLSLGEPLLAESTFHNGNMRTSNGTSERPGIDGERIHGRYRGDLMWWEAISSVGS